MLNPDQCYEALKSHDSRFDGLFYVGVSTTGIYCRPVCRVRVPGRDRCSFYPNAAMAEASGYRPCLRCRPELAPGAAPVDNVRRISDLAVARIEAGALSEISLDDLAAEYGISSRQLRRIIKQEYGVSPVELAQTCRLLLAKQLLTDTGMSMVDVAFASGFSSVRRFNHLFRTAYKLNPTALRKQCREDSNPDTVILKLGYRPPLPWPPLAQFLAGRGATRVGRMDGNKYIRTVRIGKHAGWIAAYQDTPKNQIHVEISADLLPVLPLLRVRLRHLFDLDANPTTIDSHLCLDKHLQPCTQMIPGLRIPGTLDGFELALRAVLGQQISVKAATTIFGRFAELFGDPISTPHKGLDRLAPTAEAIAGASLQQIIDRGLTMRRAETVRDLAEAVATKQLILEPGSNISQCVETLSALRGIGPWTCQYIAMRALADPDAFPDSDLALLKALQLKSPALLKSAAEPWRPWRAYAAMHLWNKLSSGG